MDYNRNNQNGSDQWDRWNSNSAHNSYYNQPTHRPYGQAFAIASLVCGLLSVTIGFCGIALPLGALGIIFAVLVRRKGKKTNSTAQTGLILSSTGVGLGSLILLLYLIFMPMMLKQQLSNESTRQQMEFMYNSLWKNSFDMEFEEYLDYISNFYNITIDE